MSKQCPYTVKDALLSITDKIRIDIHDSTSNGHLSSVHCSLDNVYSLRVFNKARDSKRTAPFSQETMLSPKELRTRKIAVMKHENYSVNILFIFRRDKRAVAVGHEHLLRTITRDHVFICIRCIFVY